MQNGKARSPEVAAMHDEDGKTEKEVEDGRERHQEGTHPPEERAAEEEQDEGGNTQRDARYSGLRAECHMDGFADGVPLQDAALKHGADNAEQGKQEREKPVPPTDGTHIVGSAAPESAVGSALARVHGEDDLGVLDRHGEKGGDQHPEDRPRPADEEREGDARDVPDPHRAAEGEAYGGERLPRLFPPVHFTERAARVQTG